MAHRLMGGSKCNSIKAATQKSGTSFSLRSCMERGLVGSFRNRPVQTVGTRADASPTSSHPLFGLRKAVHFWLALAPNLATFRTKLGRYFGPVQTQSL